MKPLQERIDDYLSARMKEFGCETLRELVAVLDETPLTRSQLGGNQEQDERAGRGAGEGDGAILNPGNGQVVDPAIDVRPGPNC